MVTAEFTLPPAGESVKICCSCCYLSGGFNERCRADTGLDSCTGLFHTLQQDSGSGDVTPGDPEARLDISTTTSAAAGVSGHMVCYLQVQTRR